MGSFVEVYDADADIMYEISGAKLKKGFRGMRTALGFPENRTMEYIRKALEWGYSAALLAEAGPGKWIRHRYVTRIWLRYEDRGDNLTVQK